LRNSIVQFVYSVPSALNEKTDYSDDDLVNSFKNIAKEFKSYEEKIEHLSKQSHLHKAQKANLLEDAKKLENKLSEIEVILNFSLKKSLKFNL